MSRLSIKKFTSSEMGAWSNAYVVHGETEALGFDVFMLKEDAKKLVADIRQIDKRLSRVFISHAHPDHFMGLEVLCDAFPDLQVISTANVVKDVRDDGPWMLKLLQEKLGRDGPGRVVIPTGIESRRLVLEGEEILVDEYESGESKHIATLYVPGLRAVLASDLIYNGAHCYLQERHLDGWLAWLDELERFAAKGVERIYPGHGEPGDPATLIASTRSYLLDFAAAVQLGDAESLEHDMLQKYPRHHAKQFLSIFSVPAYFPAGQLAPGVGKGGE